MAIAGQALRAYHTNEASRPFGPHPLSVLPGGVCLQKEPGRGARPGRRLPNAGQEPPEGQVDLDGPPAQGGGGDPGGGELGAREGRPRSGGVEPRPGWNC